MKSLILIALVLSVSAIFGAAKAESACDICTTLVSTAQEYLASNHTVSEIVVELNDACDGLPSTLAYACKSVVDSFGPTIVEMIIDGVSNNDICNELGLCSSVQVSKAAGPVKCTLCEWLVGQVEGYIETNNTETAILSFLERDCNILSKATWVAECKELVSDNAPAIVAAIFAKETPDTVCLQFKECSSSAQISLVKPAAIDENYCTICEAIVQLAENYLNTNQSESEIIDELESSCSLLPNADWVSECKSILIAYGPQIINVIIKKENPASVCAEVGLCNATAFTPVVAPESGAGVECAICNWIVTLADSYVATNTSETTILGELDYACQILKETELVDTCTAFVNEYGPDVIEALINEQTPATVCAELDMCSAAKLPVAVPTILHRATLN